MQIEITLRSDSTEDYSARDLGFLLHKHPDGVHRRDVSAGTAYVFFSEAGDDRTTAVLYLDADPVGLVRGKRDRSDGLLENYVNDRPYVANSFLAVALSRTFGQSISGRSKARQDLADRALPFEFRVRPIRVSRSGPSLEELFDPLGYRVASTVLDRSTGAHDLCILHLTGRVFLRDLLNQLYVLVPVIDNSKHWWVDQEDVESLVERAGEWLSDHPARKVIARRALRYQRSLVDIAMERLQEGESEGTTKQQQEDIRRDEEQLETPLRLHDIRLDTVAERLQEPGIESVLDLGCGEGRLIRRLRQTGKTKRIVGVDPSTRTIETARRRLGLDGDVTFGHCNITLQTGSLTYGDRRWRGFDAATLVEVIEHIDPERLGSLALSVFGDARPQRVIVTTPNREYNTLFETLPVGKLRHPDHRFEWTRQEFRDWSNEVAGEYAYDVAFEDIGPVDTALGAPSQMAVFSRREKSND